MSEEIGAGRRALLHAFVDEVKANPRVEPRVFLATTYVDELLRGNASLRRQLAQAREENARLGKWVADLQSGMYVNCVYCGHRYGPGSTTPVSMADALKTHIENCPKHPMSALKSDNQRLQAIVDRLRGLLLKEAREAVWEVWLAAHRNFRKPDGDQSPWILQLGAIKTAAIQGCDALKAVAEAASGPAQEGETAKGGSP